MPCSSTPVPQLFHGCQTNPRQFYSNVSHRKEPIVQSPFLRCVSREAKEYFPSISAIDIKEGVLKRQSANLHRKRTRAKSASPCYEQKPTSSASLQEELHRLLRGKSDDKQAKHRLEAELEESKAFLRETELRLAKAEDEREAVRRRCATIERDQIDDLKTSRERQEEYQAKILKSSLMEGYWEGFSKGLYTGFVDITQTTRRHVRSRSVGEVDLESERCILSFSLLQLALTH